jgi:polysaccharide export outer membrane protein
MRVESKLHVVGLLLAAWMLTCGGMAAVAQYAGPAVASPAKAAGGSANAAALESTEFKIAPGDVIAIATYGALELSIPTLRIGATGEVVLPYVGTMKLSGLTPSEAAAALANALKSGGFMVDPQISVQTMESPTRVITVIGEVKNPMPIPAFGRIRLLDAIAASGGLTPMASHLLTIHRAGVPDPILVELGVDAYASEASNIPLMAGDTLIVPKVGSVFILGEVKQPSAYPLSSNAPVTVMRALTLAGGVKFSAALSKARVIRTTADHHRVEIMLDLRKVMNGEQQDLALASDDVLFIPPNRFKAVIAAGGATAFATLLVGGVDAYSVAR